MSNTLFKLTLITLLILSISACGLREHEKKAILERQYSYNIDHVQNIISHAEYDAIVTGEIRYAK